MGLGCSYNIMGLGLELLHVTGGLTISANGLGLLPVNNLGSYSVTSLTIFSNGELGLLPANNLGCQSVTSLTIFSNGEFKLLRTKRK